jgi:hypothetical protein
LPGSMGAARGGNVDCRTRAALQRILSTVNY